MLRLLQQFACKYDHGIGRVAHLGMVRRQSDTMDGWIRRTSASWACDAITSNFAAGCTTSTSLMIVAASDVTNNRPRWLIKSLLRPFIAIQVSELGDDERCPTHRLARSSSVRGLIAPKRPGCCAERRPRALEGANASIGQSVQRSMYGWAIAPCSPP